MRLTNEEIVMMAEEVVNVLLEHLTDSSFGQNPKNKKTLDELASYRLDMQKDIQEIAKGHFNAAAPMTLEVGEALTVNWSNGAGRSTYTIEDDLQDGPHRLRLESEEITRYLRKRVDGVVK